MAAGMILEIIDKMTRAKYVYVQTVCMYVCERMQVCHNRRIKAHVHVHVCLAWNLKIWQK